MDYSYKFFENKACQYYPCHKGTTQINCLFCYCPLYHLEHCPGNYTRIKVNDRVIKACENCLFPHKPENYETIMEFLSQN